VKVQKAIITAAGPRQRHIPVQTLVDRDGIRKSVLSIIVEEVVGAGVEEIAVVHGPGDEASYRDAVGEHTGRLTFIEQTRARGYAGAVLTAREFTAEEPFFLTVSDHLYVSQTDRHCAQQLMDMAVAENCSVSAVQPTHESKLPFYGAIGGQLEDSQSSLYLTENVIEKPTPTEAEQRLVVPGLRAGYYLAFFGMHVLQPTVMEILADQFAEQAEDKPLSLSPALDRLAKTERYLALEIAGRRCDLDVKYGLFLAQLALAMAGEDRNEVLTQLVELLALREG